MRHTFLKELIKNTSVYEFSLNLLPKYSVNDEFIKRFKNKQ